MKKLLFFIVAAVLISSCGSSKKASGTAASGSESAASDQTISEFIESNRIPVSHRYVNQHTFEVTIVSDDPAYGYTEAKPIKVGGVSEGPLNERRFLNALAGPNGEDVAYARIGSCCEFKTKNAPFGGKGYLDKYHVLVDGQDEPVVLYINMYDADELMIPVGFTQKKF